MKKILFKLCTVLSSFAIMVTALNVNSACIIYSHQPKLPDSAQKLKQL